MCPGCSTNLEARELFSASFLTNLGSVVTPLVVIGVAAALIVRRRVGPVAAAGVVLGIGLGGFADGILLHQILQWHSMFSSVVPPDELVAMKFNMIWDGMFHALTWTASAIGVVMLFRAGKNADSVWSARLLLGSMVAGWGLFNFAEGVLDHLVLGIHHVHPGQNQLAWDIGFVTLGGIGFVLIGMFITRDAPTRMKWAEAPGG
jgi:uncharacterized membrane protein